jgi:hypothetical protein
MTLESLILLAQQLAQATITALAIDTGGTCGSHLVAGLVCAIVINGGARGGRRVYSAVKMKAQELK